MSQQPETDKQQPVIIIINSASESFHASAKLQALVTATADSGVVITNCPSREAVLVDPDRAAMVRAITETLTAVAATTKILKSAEPPRPEPRNWPKPQHMHRAPKGKPVYRR